MAYGSTNYQRLTPPTSTTRTPGTGGRFGWFMSNPSYGGNSTKPTVTPVGGGALAGGIATQNITTTPQYESDYDRYMREKAQQRQRNLIQRAGTQTQTQQPKRYDYPTINEPLIPEMRTLGDVERYTGQKWTPSQSYESSVVDTTAVIDATDALLKERLGGEMSEAARRFGAAGALMSGGGLGGGYAGTLGESERGYRRDLSEITNRYRIQAAEADAQRKLQAYNAAMGRELSAHEGYEGRRLSDVQMANQYGLSKFGLESGYDWNKYGAQLGAAQREQQDAINTLLGLYGM